jgi:hypothetical protein
MCSAHWRRCTISPLLFGMKYIEFGIKYEKSGVQWNFIFLYDIHSLSYQILAFELYE